MYKGCYKHCESEALLKGFIFKGFLKQAYSSFINVSYTNMEIHEVQQFIINLVTSEIIVSSFE